MADPAAELRVRVRRRPLPGHERVVRVPEEMRRHRSSTPVRISVRSFESREVAVRLDEHDDARRLGVRGHLLEAVDHAREHVLARLALGHLVAEHAHVLHAEGLREVDEPAPFVELLRARRGVLLVHVGGGAEVGDHEAERGEVLLRLREARARQLGHLGQVHLSRDAAQLDRGVAEAIGLLEDRAPSSRPGSPGWRRRWGSASCGPRPPRIAGAARPAASDVRNARRSRGMRSSSTVMGLYVPTITIGSRPRP